MDKSDSTTRQKALAINLDATTYGTFAEIGGGQEVARCFFLVGGAAGTVAKTMWAYDMSVSDSLDGRARHEVSWERLEAMLRLEFAQSLERLGPSPGDAKRFFAFANTKTDQAVTGNPAKDAAGSGSNFSPVPARSRRPSSFSAHLLDSTTQYQQDALGVLGVNLIHGAFLRRASVADLIDSLMDDLWRQRIEIDTIKLSGPKLRKCGQSPA